MTTMTATTSRVTAVFDSQHQAEKAVQMLRGIGVPDARLAIIRKHDQESESDDSTGERVAKGLAAGAGAGVLFGLAALAIPGVGPFITAGFLTQALGAAGGAVVSGAIVGGTSGAIAGALAKS